MQTMLVLCKRKVNFFFTSYIFKKKVEKKKCITRSKRQCLHLVCLYLFLFIFFCWLVLVAKEVEEWSVAELIYYYFFL